MVDKTPILNGLSIKQLAKQYEKNNSTNRVLDSMTKRAAKYTGKKLAEQEESQKGPTMHKRDNKYTVTPKEESVTYAVNTQFVLLLDEYIMSCARISNLTMSQDVEEVREGGNNDAPLIFFAAAKKSDVLSVERAIVDDDLAKKLKMGVRIKKGQITIAYGTYGKEQYRNLFFTNGIVTKCEYTNLDALGHEIILEKLEITHSGLTVKE